MNIKLCIWSRKSDYIDEMNHLFEGAVGYIREFSDSENEVILNNGQYAVYNSNNLDLCFKTSLVHERDGVIVSSSEPLICLDEVVQSEKDYADFIFNATKDQNNYKKIFPKYFASRISPQGMEIFNDLHGLSRCYITMNEKFVAVSNHIGVLAYFIDDVLEINNFGMHMYAQTAWYCGNTTPYNLICRVEPGTIITCKPDCVRVDKWHNMAELVRPNSKDFDVDNIISEWGILNNNLSNILRNPPTVHLSGGRDSRVVAAAWLSTEQPCTITTGGIIKQEATIASSLLNTSPGKEKLDDLGITHNIVTSDSIDINKITLEEKVTQWLLCRDGDLVTDMLTDRVEDNSPFRKVNSMIFSGLGGEISKGVYYQSESDYKKTLKNKCYYKNNINRYVAQKYKTTQGSFAKDIMVSRFNEEYISLGLDRFNLHDYFYYREKFGRWCSSYLTANFFLLLSSPSYVRESFNADPDIKRSGGVLQQIADRFMPEWKDIPYYTVSNADSKVCNDNKMRIWQTDPKFVKNLIHEGQFYEAFFNRQSIVKCYGECVNNKGFDYEQTILIMVVITEMLWKHFTKLAYRVSKHRNKYYYNIAQELTSQSERRIQE